MGWVAPLLLASSLLLGAVGPSGFVTAQTPGNAGRSTRARNPLAPEVAIGLEVATMLAETIGLCENPEWEQRLTDVGYRVASVAMDEDLPYNFRILDLPEPNAMALPGGFIFVTRGMFETGIPDDELAHLIGHEIGHVHREHFTRTSRLNTLISVLKTALAVGIMIGAPDTHSYERVEMADDPGLRNWSVGMTGKSALLQGTSIMGSVLHALFQRGYSRKLEFEADEMGHRLAVRAGYPPEAGVAMLLRLRERSYEGNRFGYWRTHPFFDDRLARAKSRLTHLSPPETPPDDSEYRQHLALYFASMAAKLPDEKQALYFYRCALQAEPYRFASLAMALKLIRFKKEREEQKHPLERHTGPLIADYDSLIAQATRIKSDWAHLAAARQERATLEESREQLLSEYMTNLEGQDSSTSCLERFLVNYPDHARTLEMTCLLGLHYQLSGRADEAVCVLQPLLAQDTSAVWADSARVIIGKSIREIEDMVVCCRLWSTFKSQGDSLLTGAASDRMDKLSSADLTLKDGGSFVQNCPETPWTTLVQNKTRERAGRMLENGLVQEGLHRYQDALNAYFAILALAPESPAASRAEICIDRIHRLEGTEN